MNLEFQQGDDTWKRLRKRALGDLYFFNSVILGYADLFPLREETHLLAHIFMDRKTGIPELDNAPFQLIMWPRECGKSSCGTIGSALQEACRNPEVSILIANEKQETAQDFIAAIKWHIESNNLLRALFPEIIPPDFNKTTWSATRATVNRTRGRPESTFDCTGVGGTKVGKHFDRVICDDLVAKNAMENARSGDWSIMHQINRWVNQLPPLLSAAAKPFPWIRFIGTNWWAGDSYEHIEDTFTYGAPIKYLSDGTMYRGNAYRFTVTTSTGRKISRMAYVAGDLAVLRISGIENGKPVFPEIWSEERMEKQRQMDPEFFACNILNSPTAAEVRVFQDDWLRYWRFVDDGHMIVYKKDDGGSKFVKVNELYKLITVDPAFSSGEEGARSAIVVLGVDMETSKMLVLETLAQRADPKDTVVDVVNAASRWDVSRVYIELAGQQLSFIQWVEREAAARGRPLHVEQLKPGGRNKDLRIESLVIPFKNGDLFVHASQAALIDDEYRKYRPGAKKRDVLDALAYAVEVCPKPHMRDGASAKQRSKQQLESFRHRYRSRYAKAPA